MKNNCFKNEYLEQDKQEVCYVNLPYIFKHFTPLQIPAYQRGYAWDSENIEALIDDIEKALATTTYKHFTGTIVLSQSHKHYFEIIDGQQRLTSLYILIKAIIDKLKDDSLLEKYIIIKKNFDTTSRLSQALDQDNFFEEYIINNNVNAVATIYSHTRIKEAKRLFDNWLKNKTAIEIKQILKTIEDKFRFIVYTPKDSYRASAMFEVINNRGKDLSELEKIKNYFVYIATLLGANHSLHKKINITWSKMLTSLNLAQVHTIDDENSFLRFCFITFFSSNRLEYQKICDKLKKSYFPINLFIQPVSEKNTDETIAQKKANKIKELQQFLNFMIDASKYYAYFLKADNLILSLNNDNLANELRRVVQYILCHSGTASITPLYLAIMCRNDIELQQKIALLEIVEKVNFRMYVLPGVLSRSDTGQAQLFTLARDFYAKKITSDDFKKKLVDIVQEWSKLDDIYKSLVLDKDDDYDFADWKGLPYFLARYEEYLERKNHKTFDVSQILKKRKNCRTGDYLSVEHIWARRNRINYAAEDYIAKRRLGNFILLELRVNIQARNDDIEKKLKLSQDIDERVGILNNTSLYQARELRGKFDEVNVQLRQKHERKGKNYYRDQGNMLADIRETALIDFALKTWAITDKEKELASKASYLAKLKK